jgi:GGDEF domain-containing protein
MEPVMVAVVLRQNVRQSEVVARFGGEEFVVLSRRPRWSSRRGERESSARW